MRAYFVFFFIFHQASSLALFHFDFMLCDVRVHRSYMALQNRRKATLLCIFLRVVLMLQIICNLLVLINMLFAQSPLASEMLTKLEDLRTEVTQKRRQLLEEHVDQDEQIANDLQHQDDSKEDAEQRRLSTVLKRHVASMHADIAQHEVEMEKRQRRRLMKNKKEDEISSHLSQEEHQDQTQEVHQEVHQEVRQEGRQEGRYQAPQEGHRVVQLVHLQGAQAGPP
jgi:hypothetical protein